MNLLNVSKVRAYPKLSDDRSWRMWFRYEGFEADGGRWIFVEYEQQTKAPRDLAHTQHLQPWPFMDAGWRPVYEHNYGTLRDGVISPSWIVRRP